MYDNNEELDLDTWADDAAATGTEVYFNRQPVPPSLREVGETGTGDYVDG